jgi:hypothetical protein
MDLPGERILFYVQHVTLVVAPLVAILCRRFFLYRPRVLYCWGLMACYHWNVLLPVSLLTGTNLNFMMVRHSEGSTFSSMSSCHQKKSHPRLIGFVVTTSPSAAHL